MCELRLHVCISTDIPFGLALVIDRHEEPIFLNFAHCVKLLHHKFNKLWLALLWDNRQAINHYKRVEALLKSNIILLF